MMAWYEELSQREQILVAAGLIALSVMVLYLLVGLPLNRHLEAARLQYRHSAETTDYLTQVADRLANFGPRGSDSGRHIDNEATFSLVNTSAREAGIHNSIRRITPQSDGTINIIIGDVAFDALIAWIAQIEEQSRVTIQRFNASAMAASGRVEANLELRAR